MTAWCAEKYISTGPSRNVEVTAHIVVLRIDKWLYFTRFYKTRGLASKAVRGGHVKINGSRAKPASSVSPGDVIEIVRDQLPWRLEAGP